MSGPDEGLAALLDDLDALPIAHRRAVLASLRPFERVRVQALLTDRRRGGPADSDGQHPPIFSAAVARCIGLAQDEENGGSGRMLTAATRERILLLAAKAQEQRSPGSDATERRQQMPLLARLARVVTGPRVRA